MLPAWLGRSFAALAIPAYRTYWLALLSSFGALWFGFVARGYLVFDLTGSNAALGGIFISFGVPQLIFTLFGGVAADRLPRKWVVAAALSIFVVEYGLVAILIFADAIRYEHLVIASIFEGTVVAFYIPARTAFVGDLVGSDEGLGNAVALQQVSFNAARVVMPLIAGGLIAVPALGVGGTYAAALFFFALAVLIVLRLPAIPARTMAKRESPLHAIVGGLRYVRSRPAILTLVLMCYCLAMTAMAYIAFIPSITADVFDGGSVHLGVMTSAIAVGALIAAVSAASIADGPNAWRMHTLAAIGFGTALMAFAVAPTFIVGVAFGVALGAAEIGFLTLNQALAMRFADAAYFGRVQALLLLSFALFGIMAFPIGFIADAIGIRQTLFAAGALATVLALAVTAYGRRINASADATSRRHEPSAAAAG